MFTTMPSYVQHGSTHSVGTTISVPTGGIIGSTPGFASTISL
jgi:hypothetical protein